MKTFLKYPGGKTKEIPLVCRYMPKQIDRYFEPFVGGGSVYLALGIQNSFINDFSTDLINVYKYIKEGNEVFKRYLMDFDEIWHSLELPEFHSVFLTKYSYLNQNVYSENYKSAIKRKRKTIQSLKNNGNVISRTNYSEIMTTARKTAFYMLVRDLYNHTNDANELRTACYYYLREYCYSSMFRFSKNGNFNVPYGGMSYNSKFITQKIEYMFSQEIQQYFENTQICNLDFENFLGHYKLKRTDFIFLDPPYDSDFSTYDKHPFDKEEQIRLRNFLVKINAKWMLIIKKTDFIHDLYKSFHIYEYDMNYVVSFKNRNKKNVEHLLITNYAIKEAD